MISGKRNRREFVQTVSAAGIGAGFLNFARANSKVPGANEAVRVAIIGLNGKGAHHIEMYKAVPGARIVALCDADENILRQHTQKLANGDIKVEPYVDIRKLLENKDIDAVSIATPNHWHSLMTVWACQAGKHVYVEKPISHNVWEGRKAVEAARKYNRIVQAGTQSRSDEALKELAVYLKGGEMGKILRVRGFCYKRRKSIGKVSGPQPIPAGVNYDLWTGPAPLGPLMRKNLHYDWHWIWPTGNGDIGNQGVHEMDMCRWMLGEKGLPNRVWAVGGRFGYEDDATTPNTLISVFEYESAPIIFEVRGLPQKSDSENMDHYKSVRIGFVVECEHGYFAGGGGGGWLFDKNGKRIRQFSSSGGDKHVENFIQAVRDEKQSTLNADIQEGHISSALCHLGNIPFRLGTDTPLKEIQERTKSRADIEETLNRFALHLAANDVNIETCSPVFGSALTFLPEQERFKSDAEYDVGFFANRLIKEEQRTPFVVPDNV